MKHRNIETIRNNGRSIPWTKPGFLLEHNNFGYILYLFNLCPDDTHVMSHLCVKTSPAVKRKNAAEDLRSFLVGYISHHVNIVV